MLVFDICKPLVDGLCWSGAMSADEWQNSMDRMDNMVKKWKGRGKILFREPRRWEGTILMYADLEASTEGVERVHRRVLEYSDGVLVQVETRKLVDLPVPVDAVEMKAEAQIYSFHWHKREYSLYFIVQEGRHQVRILVDTTVDQLDSVKDDVRLMVNKLKLVV